MTDLEESFDDDWAGKNYLESLNHLYEIAERGGNPIYILEGLISVTSSFLEYSNFTKNKEIQSEICKKFSLLKHYTKQEVLKSKIQTFDQSMAIGQFVEILIKNGLPRIHSIDACARLLDIGKSTVRTHNENFRKVFGHTEDKGLKLFTYIKYMNEKVKDIIELPSNHTRSKTAFAKTKNYYLERISFVEKAFPNMDEVLKQYS